MGYVRGWRGRIGLIFPAPGGAPDFEYHERVPEGVGVFIARLPFEACTVGGLSKMGEFVEEAAALVAQAKVDLILFACTTGSLVKGPGYDKQLIARIEKRTGIPALTTSTAVVDAMRALKMKKIAVSTPYAVEVNEAEKIFLEGSGFEVVTIRGLGNTDPIAMGAVRHETMYRLSREVYTDDVDGLFVSCTGISVLDIIDKLEKDLQKPVVTSNQASLWAALRKLGIGEKIQGLGRLFDL
ncbi:MAG: aspartate/glutamate racemase family protein [Deltaproteobacteria bacterium]|nr:aspartate/glutamate racemase family protein [Deltaproteobacteria bacterium]